VAEGLRKYSTNDIDDRHIEVILPIIQMSLLATSAGNTKISPFEVVHGFPMPLPNPVVTEQPTFLTKNADAYCAWLKNALQLLHTAVRENRIEAKMEMKYAYDSRHSAKTPTFAVSDTVVLLDRRIKPNSSRVLTHKPFNGPYLVVDKIQLYPSIGPSFKLVHKNSAKPLRHLANPDRLKLFNDNRETFGTLNPPLTFDENKQTSTEANIDSQRNDANKQPTGLEPALRVLRQRKRGVRTEYLLPFEDRTSYWTQSVSPALIESFLMTKQKQSKRRRCKKQ